MRSSRHLVLLLILLLSPVVTAQAEPPAVEAAEEKKVYEIKKGERWKVFSTMSPEKLSGVEKRGGENLRKISLKSSEAETFVVFPAFKVDELEAEGVLPATEAREIREDFLAEGLDYQKVEDLLVVHLEVAEKVAKMPPSERKGLFDFGWQDPEALFEAWDWNDAGELEVVQIEQENFQGDVTVSMPLSGNTDVTVTYQLKEKFGIPYRFRLIEAVIIGQADLQGNLTTSARFEITARWDWKKRVLYHYLGSVRFPLGPIPVSLEFTLLAHVGLEAEVRVAGEAEWTTELRGTANFEVVCTSSECTGPTEFVDSLNIADPTYELTLDARARAWARATVKMEIYDEDVGLASVSATGFVDAHLFGYLGNQCGDADGDGSNDTLADLLLDFDVGYSVDAHLSGHVLPERDWRLLEGRWHLGLWDLWEDSEGFNLADPLIVGPDNLDVGDPAVYEFTTRPCYPYSEDLFYQWTGIVEGEGTVAPRTGTLVDTATTASGEEGVVVTAVEDAHGRSFNVSTRQAVTVFDPNPTETLDNDVPATELSAPTGEDRFFAIDVPEAATNLTIDLSEGTGNADLYVRYGERPTTSTYDCRSALAGNEENCFFPFPDSGRYEIMVYSTEGHAGASLTASYTEPVTEPLFAGIPVPDLVGVSGEKTYFAVEIPGGSTDLTFELSGGTGDADLYVRYGTWPSLSAYDCRSVEVGNGDLCRFDLARGGTYYVMLYGFSAYSGASLVARFTDPGGILTNGVPETGLSGASGGRVFYSIDVPPGAHDLSIRTSGGLGDADLYVRFDALPTRALHDCSSLKIGNEDECTFRSPEAGRYDILVYGYESYSGMSLVASFVEAETLVNSVPRENLSAGAKEDVLYTIEVPEGAGQLTFTLSAEAGDPDLYVRYAAQPDRDNLLFDCASQEPEPEVDQCSFPSPQAGRYHVQVHAYTAYSGGRLEASYIEPLVDGELGNGVRQEELTGAWGSETFFKIEVPEGAADLTVGLLGGTGDADLYVRYGLQPTTSIYDCQSWNEGNGDSCFFAAPEAGTYHILVHGYSAYSGASLTASYTQPANEGGELAPGAVAGQLAGQEGEETFYTLEVPAGSTDLVFRLSGGAGDADLYVRFGAAPTTADFDCRDDEVGNDHACFFPTPQGGTYHVMILGYGDYSAADLLASFNEPGAEAIFDDDFESGGFGAWSMSEP